MTLGRRPRYAASILCERLNMDTTQKQTDGGFVGRWIGATALSFIITTYIAIASMWSIGSRLLEGLDAPFSAVLSGLWVGGLMGLGLGIGQAFALRRTGFSAARWILHSVLGGAVGFALFSVLTAEGDSTRNALALLAGGIAGLGIGFAQWLLIRNRFVNAIIWLPITAVAFMVMALLAYNGWEGREWLLLVIMGLVVAGITGLGAVLLFGRHRIAAAGQIVALLVIGLLPVGCGGSEPSVRFAEPRDGASVAAPVKVVMTAENFTVEPAGDGAIHEGAGHLHIMIDTPCIAAGQTIPKDDNHKHFGDGSTETELALAPGTHTLCLQAADGAHTALAGEGLTHSITVNVP